MTSQTMRLHRQSRDYYDLTITTDPALPGPWEASFDNGTTWHTGESYNGGWRWLLAGPDITLGSAVAQVARTMRPLVRSTSSPVVVVEVAPRINVVS